MPSRFFTATLPVNFCTQAVLFLIDAAPACGTGTGPGPRECGSVIGIVQNVVWCAKKATPLRETFFSKSPVIVPAPKTLGGVLS